MWYVPVGVWVVLIVHNVLVSAFSIRTIPYGKFLQLLKENQVSEATARLIDAEVGEIIKEQYANALEILRAKKTALKKAAGLLLENEKMNGEELKLLMDEFSA